MAEFNRVIIMGNLTRDPELKQLGGGQVCKLGIASNRTYKNRQTGAPVQEVCFIDVDVWGAQADSCAQYLQKGRPVLVEGRLRLDSWKDQDGQARNRHVIVAERVVFLGSNQEEAVEEESYAPAPTAARQQVAPARSAASRPAAAPKKPAFKDEPAFEDELPF